MEDHHRILLNPPPTKKWVTFNDWDEESGLMGVPAPAAAVSRPLAVVTRRHSSSGETAGGPWHGDLSSSLSSESSLGSTGEGGGSRRGGTRRPAATQQQATEKKREEMCSSGEGNCQEEDEDETREPIFNASFGGYKLNGEAAMMKTVWSQQTPPPSMARCSRLSTSSSVSSMESELPFSSSPPLRTISPSSIGGSETVTSSGVARCLTPASSSSMETARKWLKLTALDEVRSYEKTVSEAVLGDDQGRAAHGF